MLFMKLPRPQISKIMAFVNNDWHTIGYVVREVTKTSNFQNYGQIIQCNIDTIRAIGCLKHSRIELAHPVPVDLKK